MDKSKKLRIILYFVITLFWISCSNHKITWIVELNKDKGYMLVNRMNSYRDTNIILDRKSFSYACYYEEQINLNRDLIDIIKDLEHNQIVIENKRGNRRLYSNVYFDTDEIKDIPQTNCMFDW